MRPRIDALAGHHTRRYELLTGRVLEAEADAALQALVTRAAHELGTPIAVVSLLLERTQVFRAQVGMPADLALAGATDRDVSFCQFVVRDERMLVVADAATDARVPQDLVKRYGVRAYLGAPIAIAGQVVGALCALDVQPRAFSAHDVETLEGLAALVSRRLAELAAATPAPPAC